MFDGLIAWLNDKINAVIAWLRDLVVSFVTTLYDLFKDAVVWVIDQVGGGLVSLLGSVSLPSFVSGGLSSVFGAMPASILWIAGELQIGACLAVVGAAYAVRLVRVFVTLFQWS
jgi:hypothetical protein